MQSERPADDGHREAAGENFEASDDRLDQLSGTDTCGSDHTKFAVQGAESQPENLLLGEASRPAPLPHEPSTSLDPSAVLVSAELGFVSARLPSSDDVDLPQPVRPFSVVATAASLRQESPRQASRIFRF